MRRSSAIGQKVAALAIAITVGVFHFAASVIVGARANAVFQRWFDSGQVATGAEEAVARLNALLSVPIPTLPLNAHPSRPTPILWWSATLVNSSVWAAIAALVVLVVWRLMRARRSYWNRAVAAGSV